MNISRKYFLIILGVIIFIVVSLGFYWLNHNFQSQKPLQKTKTSADVPSLPSAPDVTNSPIQEVTPPAPISTPELPAITENQTSPIQAVTPNSPVFRHVFLVVEENHDYQDVMGNTHDMPYLNDLARTYAYAQNYYAVTHPSIGNYFMLTTGKILTNADSFGGTVDDDNIVRALLAAHKTWKEYSETLPYVGYIGADADPYEQHHNPLSYFSDVRDNAQQRQNLVPIEQLKTDITNHSLPDFALIVPNNFHDGHDCPHGGSCQKSDKLAVTDDWLKSNLDPLIKSPDFAAPGGGLLVITFDEASKSDKIGGGGHVAWVVVGSDVKRGYTSSAWYQHQSTLRLILESLGITSFPGKSKDAVSMQEFVKK
jgi:acid phosphatase